MFKLSCSEVCGMPVHCSSMLAAHAHHVNLLAMTYMTSKPLLNQSARFQVKHCRGSRRVPAEEAKILAHNGCPLASVRFLQMLLRVPEGAALSLDQMPCLLQQDMHTMLVSLTVNEHEAVQQGYRLSLVNVAVVVLCSCSVAHSEKVGSAVACSSSADA